MGISLPSSSFFFFFFFYFFFLFFFLFSYKFSIIFILSPTVYSSSFISSLFVKSHLNLPSFNFLLSLLSSLTLLHQISLSSSSLSSFISYSSSFFFISYFHSTLHSSSFNLIFLHQISLQVLSSFFHPILFISFIKYLPTFFFLFFPLHRPSFSST